MSNFNAGVIRENLRYIREHLRLNVMKYTNIIIILILIISAISFTNIYLSKRYYNLAEKDFSKMRWQEAISNYDKAIKFMPINADNYARKAGIYALKATLNFKPEEKIEYRKIAINNFKKAIDMNSYQSEYYLNLAWLYSEEDRQKETINAFHKAIEVNPTDSALYFHYADYCLEHNLLNEALKIYRESLGLFINDDGPFRRLYGSIYGMLEKIYKHTQEYNLLKSVVPEDTLYMRLEFVYFLETKKRISEAYNEYREILAKYPNSEEAKKAIKRLEKDNPWLNQ